MKDLRAASRAEQLAFFQSFDQVLCDIDGVLWHFPDPIPGALASITLLRRLQKRIIFVSNKTTKSHQENLQQLNLAGFQIREQDLVMPETATISHLKKINFNKEIFYLGLTPFKDALIKSGFQIGEYPPQTMEESVPNFIRTVLTDNPKIGAVIADIDLNVNYLKLARAALYLKRPGVLFISVNSTSKLLNAGPQIFNSWYFDYILQDFTGRTPLRLAKPSPDYNDFIREEHEMGAPGRVLFIGDSVDEDMGFASACGYRKLLVLSGMTPKEAVEGWEFPEELKPEFYVDSLDTVADVLGELGVN